MIITKLKILEAIRQFKTDKAPGPDGISNKILKACAEKLSVLLVPLFQACITYLYHLQAFKMANMVTMKKPGKADYTTPKTYCSIVLLNTLGKVLKSIIGKKITYLAEKHHLLLDTQMGVRKNRSIETVLELLIKQIHTVWEQSNDKIATLLSIIIAKAFDTVSHL